MKSVVTVEEAARLWGCTPRHIQWLAKRGKLKAVDYYVTQHKLDAVRMLLVRRPLFSPADVLALRSHRKDGRSENARRLNAEHKDKIRAAVSKSSLQMGRIWRSMPAEERAKWGRRWKRGVMKWRQRAAVA